MKRTPKGVRFGLSKSFCFKIRCQKVKGIERGDSVKGGRGPRFHVQELARRRPISAVCEIVRQVGDLVDNLMDAERRPFFCFVFIVHLTSFWKDFSCVILARRMRTRYNVNYGFIPKRRREVVAE